MEDEKQEIATALIDDLVSLSKQKFSSNVIEKLLKLDIGNFRSEMLHKLKDHDLLFELICDEYANYVL